MRQIFLLLLLCSLNSFSQTQKDSITERVSSSFYARSMFASLVSDGFTDKNGVMIAEKLKDRFTPTIEVGKSFHVLDMGISLGNINTMVDLDNNLGQRCFVEGKLTMNACQYGNISSEISVGAGYVFNSQTPVILELSTNIMVQVDDNLGIGVIYGGYELTGDNYDFNKSFTGIFLRYGLIRDDGGFLLNRTKVKYKKTKFKQVKKVKQVKK